MNFGLTLREIDGGVGRELGVKAVLMEFQKRRIRGIRRDVREWRE